MKTITAVISTLAVIGLGFLFGPQISHGLAIFFTGGAFILIPLVAVIGLVIWAMAAERAGETIWLPVVIIVAIGGASVVSLVRYEYDLGTKYLAEVEVVDTDSPDFAERAPYDVAAAGSTRLLGDTTGEAMNVKSLVDEGDHGTYNALVVSRGLFPGYESVQVQDVPLYGAPTSRDIDTCEFNGARASHRLGGFWPSESLDYLVLGSVPLNVAFQSTDTYGYCDGDTAKIVIPLQSLDGFWTPVWSSYGVAVYDGSTGTVTIETDTSDIPGPVYPLSLARTQREALLSTGTFEDRFFNRSGWEDSSGDTDDPNAGNRSEFGLRYVDDNDGAFITPLTPRGDSTSIVAVSVVDATRSELGQRNTITVHRYDKGESRQANSAVAQEIKTSYSWMPDWASGLTIFEIVPGKDGTWIASIGQTQSVVYRAVISADGSAVLYDETGERVIRTNDGNEPDVENPSVPVDSDLADLTPAELRELADTVLDELERRAGTPTIP